MPFGGRGRPTVNARGAKMSLNLFLAKARKPLTPYCLVHCELFDTFFLPFNHRQRVVSPGVDHHRFVGHHVHHGPGS
jgi:hypothetical protein